MAHDMCAGADGKPANSECLCCAECYCCAAAAAAVTVAMPAADVAATQSGASAADGTSGDPTEDEDATSEGSRLLQQAANLQSSANRASCNRSRLVVMLFAAAAALASVLVLVGLLGGFSAPQPERAQQPVVQLTPPAAVGNTSRPPPPMEEQERARRLLAAWARTGDCAVPPVATRCGCIAAVVGSNDGDAPPQTLAVGQASAGGGSGPNFSNSTLFEIASISKVLTAITAHRLAAERQLSLENMTVGGLLPPSSCSAAVATIRLPELLSHTAGLARLPSNLHGTPANPFTGYTAADLYSYLRTVNRLPTRGHFFYSNLGFGLLGHLLELWTGVAYEQLVKEELLAPLGMRDTVVTLPAAASATRVARGTRRSNGEHAARDTGYGVLQGQGAFLSSSRDMAAFLAAHLSAIRAEDAAAGAKAIGLPASLVVAMRRAVEPLAADEFVAAKGQVGSGWQIYSSEGQPVIWKSGATGGYAVYMALNVATGRAAVTLGSCGGCGDAAVGQLTRLLLERPRQQPEWRQQSATTTDAELMAYVGCYRMPATRGEHGDDWVSPTLDATEEVPAALLRVRLGSGTGAPSLQLSVVGGGQAELVPWRTTMTRTSLTEVRRCDSLRRFRFELERTKDTVILDTPVGRGDRGADGATELRIVELELGWRVANFHCDAGRQISEPLVFGVDARAQVLVLHVGGVDLHAVRVDEIHDCR
eukprot:SAG31_NODE_4696_length_3026_cov_3.073454_2_plen_707_part_00